jgi:hypothetical protein
MDNNTVGNSHWLTLHAIKYFPALIELVLDPLLNDLILDLAARKETVCNKVTKILWAISFFIESLKTCRSIHILHKMLHVVI